ncbi:hypothetical protein [Endothiovibrio diazotrophicus]
MSVSRSEAEQTTLGEALKRYLREVTPAKKGADQGKRKIRLWQNRKLALRPLASIRGADLAEFRDQRLADGRSPYTVNHDLNLISHLLPMPPMAMKRSIGLRWTSLPGLATQSVSRESSCSRPTRRRDRIST